MNIKLIFDSIFTKSNLLDLNTYPLNLLTDMNTLNMCALTFTTLIINALLISYLKDKDITLFLPKAVRAFIIRHTVPWLNSNIGKALSALILYLYNRNLLLWYNSRQFIIIFSIAMLFFCLLINQLCFFIILNSGG